MFNFADMTWEHIRALPPQSAVAILPLGATEAHGPHLPLATDVIISEAMARRAAQLIHERPGGLKPVILPSLYYTPAPFASAFPGTISLRPETMTAVLIDLASSLESAGFSTLAIANSHLDPLHLGALEAALIQISESSLKIAFPNIVTRELARLMPEEFKTGACHAGQYETSIVMAARPDLVHEEIRATLDPVPHSLSRAIREGKTSFEASGGPRAYFGWPANATEEEGHRTIELMANMLVDAITQSTRTRS